MCSCRRRSPRTEVWRLQCREAPPRECVVAVLIAHQEDEVGLVTGGSVEDEERQGERQGGHDDREARRSPLRSSVFRSLLALVGLSFLAQPPAVDLGWSQHASHMWLDLPRAAWVRVVLLLVLVLVLVLAGW